MEKGELSGGKQQNREKRRRSQAQFNKDTDKYICYCKKEYLSYPALYLHIKNKHTTYLEGSKDGKKMLTTSLVKSFSKQGTTIYRIRADPNIAQKEQKQANNSNNQMGSHFLHDQNYMGYSNLQFSNPYFSYMTPDNINAAFSKSSQRNAVIEVALSVYLETLSQRQVKQRYEVQLFFLLLVDCINKHYSTLNDPRTESKEIKRYTAEFNSEYIINILPYFQSEYLKQIEGTPPYAFFIENSNIMSSEDYKNVLERFYYYIFQEDQNKRLNILNAPSLPSDIDDNDEDASEEEQLKEPEEESLKLPEDEEEEKYDHANEDS